MVQCLEAQSTVYRGQVLEFLTAPSQTKHSEQDMGLVAIGEGWAKENFRTAPLFVSLLF